MSKNIDYATDNLLDYEYFSKHDKLIATVLSKNVKLENPDLKRKNNFIGKLEEDLATMLFIIEKSEEIAFEFLINAVSIVSDNMETQKIMNLLNDLTNDES